MKPLVSVREYARLTTEAVPSSLDRAHISVTAFDWLCRLNESFSRAGAALVQVEGRRWLKLDNYVGVLETPCGTRLEILPKHIEADTCLAQSRLLLRRMIQAALDLPTREAGPAALELFDAPTSEWVMRQFLQALDYLLKRGLRFDYRRVEQEQRFLRGQLNVAAQLRQPPGRQQRFQIRHDLFLPDRAENRLLRLALDRVCQTTQESGNWRLAHELRGLLLEIPPSRQIREDLRAWRNDRLMTHYQPVKPWCELIINQQMPLAVAGAWQGLSLLFPMEKLFERYVATWLKQALPNTARLTTQATGKYLCGHDGGRIFRLQPDLLVQRGEQRWVLDTKWKRLDTTNRSDNYGLDQADFYQMFAYGRQYLAGQGELILIYPRRAAFREALAPFGFGDGMRLWVLPFDLESEELIGVAQTTLPMST
ncbi:McrC family protein [Azomonas macrocytogenes]|uniref:5-methylcytosine-specific restriction enzyme subunit McrC n=1 Tax=Azomonas macrocytogenes TaxID=69962 RepID=A0A839T4D2_AZOMA|nr:McrC family protein [Azomonas macrocytogenes]MBB3103859.1 5-methylcytosine-specific restriction enzyme subunit McrC [Azomonas macrocytogenes]